MRRVRSFAIRYRGADLRVLSVALESPPLPESLTPAEREVCALVLAGRSNKDIARERGSATRTVANQIASIFKKLGVGSRAELVARFSP